MMSVAFSIDMVMLTALAFSLHAFKHGVVHPLELFLVSFCRLLDALLLKLLLLDLLFELLGVFLFIIASVTTGARSLFVTFGHFAPKYFCGILICL